MENSFETEYYTLEVLLEKWQTKELEWHGFLSFSESNGKKRFTSTNPTEGKKFTTLDEIEKAIDSMIDYEPAKAFRVYKTTIEQFTSKIKK